MSKCAFCGVQTSEGICASCLDYRFPHLSSRIKQILEKGGAEVVKEFEKMETQEATCQWRARACKVHKDFLCPRCSKVIPKGSTIAVISQQCLTDFFVYNIIEDGMCLDCGASAGLNKDELLSEKVIVMRTKEISLTIWKEVKNGEEKIHAIGLPLSPLPW